MNSLSKLLILLFLGFFLIQMPSWAQNHEIVKQFVAASNKLNWQEAAACLDKKYKSEQCDKLLNGDFEKFMNELYCGQILDASGAASNDYSCPGTSKIKKIEYESTSDFEVVNKKIKLASVYFVVHTSDGKKIRMTLSLKEVKKLFGKKATLIGSMG